MTLQTSDIVPISEARARLTELAEDVVGKGSEKVLTKNGASYVALVDARRLDYYHALEAEHVNLVLADNRIALPANLWDGNDFLFDIQPEGHVGGGWRASTVWYESNYPVFNDGGAQLEINNQAFIGDSSALLEAGRRQFAITQPAPLAGLNVTRKVYVPRGGYFARYLEERRAEPREDVLSQLANVRFPDGELPPVMDVVRIAAIVFAAGQETTARLLCAGMRFLAEQPALVDELRSDPSAIPNFIEECLRLEGPIKGSFRLALRDTQLAGVEIPAGAMVMAAIGALPHDALDGVLCFGEVGLDGAFAPAPGALPAAMAANGMGCAFICPESCGPEAAWAGGEVLAAPSLRFGRWPPMGPLTASMISSTVIRLAGRASR